MRTFRELTLQITSGSFVLALVVVVLVYYLLPRRAQNYWLLLASYAFCVTWAWQFALVMLLVTAVNYFLARRQPEQGKGSKGLLWAAIGFNILVLAVFRLGNFYAPDLQALLESLGWRLQAGVLQILLPIGLSFYIVENISYQVDVYRKQVKASADLVDYALYQAYFPKLLAGPIERAGSFLPKLAQQRYVDNELLARSVTLIVVGALRKMLIADALATAIPPAVFESPAFFSAFELWGWLIVYGFALYNDFAGYTSIVRGISGLFGIELSRNFWQPYFSRNFTEFWNSWHITLSHWLRDYIYFPTVRALLRRSRGRATVANVLVPPMATMLVSGLWHGFSLHMVVWGGLHGLYLIGERVLALRGGARAAAARPRWQQAASMLVVFLLVMWAWVPFRLEMPAALAFWRQLLAFGDFGLHHRRLILAGGYVFLSLAIDIVSRWQQDEVVYLRWPRLAQAFLLATALFLLIIISAGNTTDVFVYQGF
jgi:alginate O-acetyltransferase complex protein AlgI